MLGSIDITAGLISPIHETNRGAKNPTQSRQETDVVAIKMTTALNNCTYEYLCILLPRSGTIYTILNLSRKVAKYETIMLHDILDRVIIINVTTYNR